MIYLILAIACSASMGIVIHYAQEWDCNMKMVTLMNYVITIGMCFGLMKKKDIWPHNGEMNLVLLFGLIDGILFLASLLLYQINVRRNGTPLTVSFSHLGVLVPTILSIVIFGESPSKVQWIGVAFAITAILVINFERHSDHELGFKIGLVILFLVGGCTDLMSKVFETYGNHRYDHLFLFYTFTMAFFLCLIWVAATHSFSMGKKEIGFGILMGVFNYTSTMFLLQALMTMKAFIAYPVYSVGVIVFINLMNVILLKEKISKRQFAGMILISVALVFLNL